MYPLLVRLLLFVSAAGSRMERIERMDHSNQSISQPSDLPGRHQKCAEACLTDVKDQKDQVGEWWQWDSEPDVAPAVAQKNCCAEGLICDAETLRCELAILEPCWHSPKKPKKEEKKSFLKRALRKLSGKKPQPEKEEPTRRKMKCGKYFWGHKTYCSDTDYYDRTTYCCVESFDLNDIKYEILEYNVDPQTMKIPSPNKGWAYVPPGGNSFYCCSGLGYSWPNGQQACVKRSNRKIAEKMHGLTELKFRKTHWMEKGDETKWS